MSTVILKRDWKDTRDEKVTHKKDASISVPFVLGQTLVAEKIAEYPPQPAVATSPPNVAQQTENDRLRADIERMKATHAAELKAVRDEAEQAAKKK